MTAFAAAAGGRAAEYPHGLSRAFNPMSFSLFARDDAPAKDPTAMQWPAQTDGKAAMAGRPLNSRASPFQPTKPTFGPGNLTANAVTSVPLVPYFGASAARVTPQQQYQQQQVPASQTRFGFGPSNNGQQHNATTMRVPQEQPQGFRMTTHDLSALRASYQQRLAPANTNQPESMYSFSAMQQQYPFQQPAPMQLPANARLQASALLTSSVAASMSHSHLGHVDEKEILLHSWPDNHAALSVAASVVDDEAEAKAPNRYAMPHPQHPLVKAAATSGSGNVLSPYSPDVGSGSPSPSDDDSPPQGNEVQSGESPAAMKQPKKAAASTSNGLSDLYKTEICQNWLRTKNCSYGNKCHYAHGKADMRARKRIQTFKTQPCADPARAGCHVCMYSTRCNYCHPGEAVRRGGAGDKPYFDADYAVLLKKDFPHVEAPFGVYV